MWEYIPRVVRWALLGYCFRGPNGAPRVQLKIRPKPEIFRVSEPTNPWANIRTRTRNPQTRNPRISDPYPIRCHPWRVVRILQPILDEAVNFVEAHVYILVLLIL